MYFAMNLNLLAFIAICINAQVIILDRRNSITDKIHNAYDDLKEEVKDEIADAKEHLSNLKDNIEEFAEKTVSFVQDKKYLVFFKDSASKATYSGASVEESYSHGFAGTMTNSTFQEYLQNNNVSSIEEDTVYTTSEEQLNAVWGLNRISNTDYLSGSSAGTYVYESSNSSGVYTYIIDTGIRTTHKEFEGRASVGYNKVDSDDSTDGKGHGTHVAGIIGSKTYGVFKDAQIIGVKVLDSQGKAYKSTILAGIEWVINQHQKHKSDANFKGTVINMSLSGTYSLITNTMIKRATKKGIHVVVSAGNNNKDACSYSPASASSAITVGAIDHFTKRSSFSNYGKCVDIFAPGTNIYSTYNTNDEATAYLSGTSMSAPYVTGLISYFLSLAPSKSSGYSSVSAITPSQLGKAIVSFGLKDKITDAGTDSPNVLAYNGGTNSLDSLWTAIA